MDIKLSDGDIARVETYARDHGVSADKALSRAVKTFTRPDPTHDRRIMDVTAEVMVSAAVEYAMVRLARVYRQDETYFADLRALYQGLETMLGTKGHTAIDVDGVARHCRVCSDRTRRYRDTLASTYPAANEFMIDDLDVLLERAGSLVGAVGMLCIRLGQVRAEASAFGLPMSVDVVRAAVRIMVDD